MYEQAMGFKEKPFSLLPDSGFLFLGKKHKAALSMLEYGLMNRAAFSVITGEIGCGKTTLVRYLLDQLESNVTVGLITNTHESLGDILQLVLFAFNLKSSGTEKIDRLQTFTNFVIGEYAKDQSVVLIIDEAQHMNLSKLEELRMLSNINADKHLVLQVVLVGQPELREILYSAELVQFSQRLMVDYHLGPLDLEETGEYIRHRLKVAGGKPSTFRRDSYEIIYRYTGGVPRLINITCDTALNYAFAAKKKTVNAEIVRTVLRDKVLSALRPRSQTFAASTDPIFDAQTNEWDFGSDDIQRLDSNFRELLQEAGTGIDDEPDGEQMDEVKRTMLRELFSTGRDEES